MKRTDRRPSKRRPLLTVRPAPGPVKHKAIATFGHRAFTCCIGKNGVTTRKREGDGATPAARMMISSGYFKPNRSIEHGAAPWLRPIRADLGWCDDPRSAAYNRPVRLPFRGNCEQMLRHDNLYDICLVLNWNTGPRARMLGSAIFLHCAPSGFGPTAGCVALEKSVLRRLLPFIGPGTGVRVAI